MDEAFTIASPAELDSYISQLQQGTSPNPHISICLLQPLSDPSILSQCRNPSGRSGIAEHGRQMHFKSGKTYRESAHEFLDLAALGKVWREMWKKLPLESIDKITFDLNLPLVPVDPEVEKLYPQMDKDRWTGFWRDAEGIMVGINSHDAARLAILLATEAKMRKPKDKALTFDKLYRPSGFETRESFSNLASYLEKLSGFGNTS
jgi:hypothetical protein